MVYAEDDVIRLFTEIPEMQREIEELKTINNELLEAVKAMVEDGWLLCGSEGTSDAQQKVIDAYARVANLIGDKL